MSQQQSPQQLLARVTSAQMQNIQAGTAGGAGWPPANTSGLQQNPAAVMAALQNIVTASNMANQQQQRMGFTGQQGQQAPGQLDMASLLSNINNISKQQGQQQGYSALTNQILTNGNMAVTLQSQQQGQNAGGYRAVPPYGQQQLQGNQMSPNVVHQIHSQVAQLQQQMQAQTQVQHNAQAQAAQAQIAQSSTALLAQQFLQQANQMAAASPAMSASPVAPLVAVPPPPAAVGVIASPYASFRTSPNVTDHGCAHLYQLFTQTRPANAADWSQKRSKKQDLMDEYTAAVRYSLAFEYRTEIIAGIEARNNGRRKRKLGDDDMDEDTEMPGTSSLKGKAGLEKLEKMVAKLKNQACSKCNSPLPRIHACLECVHMGCWAPEKYGDAHIREHLEQSGHNFAIDLSNHSLYCRQCRDYVYDIEFERLLSIERISMSETVSFLLASSSGAAIPVKMDTPLSPSASRMALIPLISTKRMRYEPTPLPEVSTIQSIRQHFKLSPVCPRGLRGLRNLGSTCFMNVVLQAVVHNPVMRSWWLGDGHNSRTCAQGRGPGGVCMACQVDVLFTQFYSDLRKPFGPSAFLHALWMSQSHLAGYAQQDAHEFFISLLGQLHQDLSSAPHGNSLGCRCIVHQSFGGVLQSDVRCEKCGNVTTAWDPILDLSLELKGLGAGKQPAADHSINGGTPIPGVTSGPALTLAECLDRFTHPERLSSGSYTCRSCGAPNAAATKQMSVRTLPQVLAIQLKRFEHLLGSFSAGAGKPAKVKGEGRKVDTFVRIPVHLDMQGYTSDGVRKRRLRSDAIQHSQAQDSMTSPLMSPSASSASLAAWAQSGENEEEDLSKVHPDPGYQYTLFAVIEHLGKLDSGHYRAYVKSRGQWFAFDDHVVTTISQKAVLDCKAYLTFYVKDTFDFGEEPEPQKPKLSPLQQLLPPQQMPVIDDAKPASLPNLQHAAIATGQPLQRSPSAGQQALNRPTSLPTLKAPPPGKMGNGSGNSSPMAGTMSGKTVPGGLNSFMGNLNMAPPPTGTFSSQPGTPPGRLITRSPSGTPPSANGNGKGKSSPAARSGQSSPQLPIARQMTEEEIAQAQWQQVMQQKQMNSRKN